MIPNDTVSFVEDQKSPPIQGLFEVVNECLLGLGLNGVEMRTHVCENPHVCDVNLEPLEQDLFEMAHHGLVGKEKKRKKLLGEGNAKKKRKKRRNTKDRCLERKSKSTTPVKESQSSSHLYI